MECAARTLVGVGLVLAFAPTAWTGWAEWSDAGHREKRVGVVHAVVNGLSAGVFAASWVARRQGKDAAGQPLSLVGLSISGAAAYLGGHLAAARKVSSHHPAFSPLSRPGQGVVSGTVQRSRPATSQTVP